ncbi:GMC family oxidoreductase [Aquimarina pacifica]|uniref:GMC family oxidoreductase n=1 Tax=Aquimarina pacifica TaxID=1296415 RepID=UPI000472A593|nr:GMC family oxidoreductase [Aquimarina pacifica]
MQLSYDYIVVGSGATGAIAAKTLVDAGVQVGLLDIGEEDRTHKNKIPNTDFISIRKKDQEQYSYFLGNEFEGVPWETTKVGSQLTPPRSFLTRFSEKLIPFRSDSFQPMESTAKGGLGGGWGLGCYTFSKLELEALGLDEAEMLPAYQSVASYIGVSGEKDDSKPYCLRDLEDIQPATKIEDNLKNIFDRYQKKKKFLNKNDIYLGRSALALLTKDKGDRSATKYQDMGFWSDANKSAYRSWITIEELMKQPNFSYHKHCLVTKFEEDHDGVAVFVKRTDTDEEIKFTCKKLILSPGVLGTARIVTRSFDYKKEKLPIICNPYSYIPCLQWRRLGKKIEQYKTSFAQLVLYVDEYQNNFDVGMAALFSYRSLLLFKLIKETPLNFADARILMQFLHSSFTIAGIHHPDQGTVNKFITLQKDSNQYTGDILTGEYVLSDEELRINLSREKKIRKALKTLGCIPLKTIRTPLGGSIHYGGTLPFDESGELFTISKSGKLAGTKNVFVADGSGFKYLPAKGLTLTLMANAYRVAKNVLKNE